ncbi:MAG: diguanylate cyclase [Nitrospirota bacterium]
MKKLLIVDDSPSTRNALHQILEKAGFFSNILEAENGAKALDILLKDKVDFVISDVNMPTLDGFKLLSAIRDQPKYHDLPVIFLTVRKDSLDKIKGLESGANDYIIKPFDPEELLARVNNLIRMKDLQDRLEKQNKDLEIINKKLEELSVTDGLTGLHNRRYFIERLGSEFSRSKRYKLCISLLLVDLDYFKSINDTYGHQKGDDVLIKVADIIKQNCRVHDILARFGGEEFIISLCQTGPEGALIVAERIRKAVEEYQFIYPGAPDFNTTISAGISSYPDIKIDNIDDLIRIADASLYEAKRQGRNRIVSG